MLSLLPNTYLFQSTCSRNITDSFKAKGFNQRIIEYDISEVVNPAGQEQFQTQLNELNETKIFC